jgi:hypothetical protein
MCVLPSPTKGRSLSEWRTERPGRLLPGRQTEAYVPDAEKEPSINH